MKRSEMIEIISDLLEELYAEHQPTKIANIFLIEMERHGMLPPSIMICDLSKTGTVDAVTNYRTINIWEPEE